MSQWTKEELAAIAKDENLYLSIPNPDGTMHKPAWIWVVQAGDELYCRGYFGRNARRYQSAKRERQGPSFSRWHSKRSSFGISY